MTRPRLCPSTLTVISLLRSTNPTSTPVRFPALPHSISFLADIHNALKITGIDIRPTISVTKAHIKLIDMDEAVRSGSLEVDGKIVVKTPTEWINANKAASAEAKSARAEDDAASKATLYSNFDAGVELNVSKAALEPVWYLPGEFQITHTRLGRLERLLTCCLRFAGIAERFGITEGALRRSLFEDTGGMYPELLTRHDLKTFLPPIGGMTVYIVSCLCLSIAALDSAS